MFNLIGMSRVLLNALKDEGDHETCQRHQYPDMSAFWMPFTANQQFQAAPRILKSAEGMYYHQRMAARYWMALPGSGVATQAMVGARSPRRSPSRSPHLDFCPTFQMGHPRRSELANRLVEIAPRDSVTSLYQLRSESVDTAPQDCAGLAAGLRPGTRTGSSAASAATTGWVLAASRWGHSRQPQVVRLPADRGWIICPTPST